MTGAGVHKIHAAQNAAADMMDVAVAVHVSRVAERIICVVRAVAVLEERAKGQASGGESRAEGQAGQQRKAGDIHMGA